MPQPGKPCLHPLKEQGDGEDSDAITVITLLPGTKGFAFAKPGVGRDHYFQWF